MKQRDEDLLQRIIQYCDRVADYLQRICSDKDYFLADPMIQDACCMCIVQIGELSGLISDELKQAHTEIPWRAIKDTRNFYVHDYGGVDLSLVWDALIHDLPVLQKWCEAYPGKRG